MFIPGDHVWHRDVAQGQHHQADNHTCLTLISTISLSHCRNKSAATAARNTDSSNGGIQAEAMLLLRQRAFKGWQEPCHAAVHSKPRAVLSTIKHHMSASFVSGARSFRSLVLSGGKPASTLKKPTWSRCYTHAGTDAGTDVVLNMRNSSLHCSWYYPQLGRGGAAHARALVF